MYLNILFLSILSDTLDIYYLVFHDVVICMLRTCICLFECI